LYEVFSRHGQIVIQPDQHTVQTKCYPVEALMRQTATDFYKWYTAEVTTRHLWALQFEVFDAPWPRKDAFLVSSGQLHYFQMLKQSIWDSFWTAFYLHGGPTPFRISIHHLVCKGAMHEVDSIPAIAVPRTPYSWPDSDTADRHAVRVLLPQGRYEVPPYKLALSKLKFVPNSLRRLGRRHRSNIYQRLN
jgi:hypothetical protein